MREGDLVEVTLVNEDVEDGVTVHWHGLDVPNAEDGVAGVTQDAVPPGGRHVYRFRPEQVGTFWYHSHQIASKQVRRGLLGALVVEPREGAAAGLDLSVVAHELGGRSALDGNEGSGSGPFPKVRLCGYVSSTPRTRRGGSRSAALLSVSSRSTAPTCTSRPL